MENESIQKHCSTCGKKHPDDAQYCSFCGCLLTQPPATQQRIEVKISTLATKSFICALCGLVLLAPSLITMGNPRALNLGMRWMIALTFLASHFALIASFFLGLISIIQIELSGGRITGRLFAVGAILIPVFGGLLPFWAIVLSRPRSRAFRMVCGTNLSGIGKAMLIYANDYDDQLPRAGVESSVWAAKISDWKATNRFTAFNIKPDGTGGQASISSSFYLLVKYAEVQPKSFNCKQDSGVKEFKPGGYKIRDRDLIDLWDFGPEPQKHCSYSYHVPYGGYPLTTSCDPKLAVAADRNPWIDSPFRKARDFQAFDPDGGKEAIKAGNTIAHQTDAQNVLFLDIHVGQQKHSFCGINDDNIYTSWNGEDKRRGTPPKLGSKPADRADSLLVNDPAISK
ncbi:MAG: hypothetical protein ACYSTT_09180 [Planctomycetota bacterium]